MKIEAKQVVAGYGGGPVLNGVSITVEPGEFVAILGPNGSGKSTLIRGLSRTLRPEAGEVLIGGEDLYALTSIEAARRIAVVPQMEDPVFDFTIREIVEMGRYARGGGVEEVQSALERTRTAALSDRHISTLSGGERQRVLLARALAQETSVLLLDEPTAHMDVGYQIAMLTMVRSLARGERDGPKAVLAALHDLNLASGFADRAILLHDGHITAEGPVEEVLQSPEIERVYGAAFERIRDPRTGRLILSPEFVPERAKARRPRRVHVIGGGGSAAALLNELWQLGHVLSLGITHANDSDCETAQRLGIPVAAAPPFSTFDLSRREEAHRLAAGAEIILLCPAPYGLANIENLRLAEDLLDSGKKLLLVARSDGQWDFTDGEASRLAAGLESSNPLVRPDMISRALEED